MYRTIIETLNEASRDKDTRAVVLTGTGKYYSAGNDLSAFMTVDLSNMKEVQKMAEEAKNVLIEYVDSFIS